MRLRAPAYPLINIDPYFSVWSESDRLTDGNTYHWAESPQTISGIADIDGEKFRFIGNYNKDIPAMKQLSVDVNCFTTTYVFEAKGVKLTLKFTSPVIPTDLYYISRPVTYLEIEKEYTDGHRHRVSVRIAVSEEICMNLKGDGAVDIETLELDAGISSIKIGLNEQKILNRSGDDLRIEWGYFYLSGKGKVYSETDADGLNFVCIEKELDKDFLVSFAYDDIYSLDYFGEWLKAYWNRNGADIKDEIVKAHKEYRTLLARCTEFDMKLFCDAVKAGGEKYAEMLQLAFRQVINAHKLAIDKNGELIYVSKECYSNGCAATVDLSYPSCPFFLLYNPELIKGMMRPIYRYAGSEAWPFDFSPHDCGQYPLVRGQVYGNNALDKQMPVEECGNMIVMEAAVAIAGKSTAFADEHMDIIDTWVKYLIDNGRDPGNQLCTDDFAGHLAHNCNLSLKAIMGIAGYGIIKGMKGQKAEKNKYLALAHSMCLDWAKRASNGDGSYRLAFDQPGTFSMKYNIVWDKLFGTALMPAEVLESEVSSYFRRIHPYGLDLDNRKTYTKSDWIVWTATLANNRDDFERIVNPMWDCYNTTESRVPMTDWYWTQTGLHKSYFSKRCGHDISFRNRSVIGGLFIKLLEYKGTVSL